MTENTETLTEKETNVYDEAAGLFKEGKKAEAIKHIEEKLGIAEAIAAAKSVGYEMPYTVTNTQEGVTNTQEKES